MTFMPFEQVIDWNQVCIIPYFTFLYMKKFTIFVRYIRSGLILYSNDT